MPPEPLTIESDGLELAGLLYRPAGAPRGGLLEQAERARRVRRADRPLREGHRGSERPRRRSDDGHRELRRLLEIDEGVAGQVRRDDGVLLERLPPGARVRSDPHQAAAHPDAKGSWSAGISGSRCLRNLDTPRHQSCI